MAPAKVNTVRLKDLKNSESSMIELVNQARSNPIVRLEPILAEILRNMLRTKFYTWYGSQAWPRDKPSTDRC